LIRVSDKTNQRGTNLGYNHDLLLDIFSTPSKEETLQIIAPESAIPQRIEYLKNPGPKFFRLLDWNSFLHLSGANDQTCLSNMRAMQVDDNFQ